MAGAAKTAALPGFARQKQRKNVVFWPRRAPHFELPALFDEAGPISTSCSDPKGTISRFSGWTESWGRGTHKKMLRLFYCVPQRVRSKRLCNGIPENPNGLIRSMVILPASENPMACTVPGRKNQEAPYDPVFIFRHSVA